MLSPLLFLGVAFHASVITQRQFDLDGGNFASHQRLGRNPAFSAVGVVEGYDREKQVFMAASGTYIGGMCILTAAHLSCNDRGEEADPTKFRFRLVKAGRVIDYRGVRWHVVDAYKRDRAKDQGYTMNMVWGDLAVLEIDRNPANDGFTPPKMLERGVQEGDTVCMVGYGDRGTNEIEPSTGKFGRGALDPVPTPLAFYQLVTTLQDGYGARTLFDLDAPLRLQGQPSAGDSGGAVFFEDRGSWKYCGIISGGGAIDGKALQWPFQKASGRFVDLIRHHEKLKQGLLGDWAPLEKFRVGAE